MLYNKCVVYAVHNTTNKRVWKAALRNILYEDYTFPYPDQVSAKKMEQMIY